MLLEPEAYALLYALARGQCDLIWLCHSRLLPCACTERLPCQMRTCDCFGQSEWGQTAQAAWLMRWHCAVTTLAVISDCGRLADMHACEGMACDGILHQHAWRESPQRVRLPEKCREDTTLH